MLGHTRGKRSPVTCSLKCDNACSKAVCNTSQNSYFRDIASFAFTRRAALGLGLAGALSAAVVLTGCGPEGDGGTAGPTASGKLEFTPIKAVDAAVDTFDVPQGYSWAPILRWVGIGAIALIIVGGAAFLIWQDKRKQKLNALPPIALPGTVDGNAYPPADSQGGQEATT